MMLGRLARWLRLLGFDTLYDSSISDSRLIRIAKEQERIILTRDTRLVKIKGIQNYLLIISNEPFKQLHEVINTLHLKDFQPLSRCVICNGRLIRVLDKNEIRDSVPEYVFYNFHNFLKCCMCNKIYWQGTHPLMFKKKLRQVLINHQ
ncbi:MAG: Mut7-C RNAse domain-containing protein [Thermodesulfovibrionales bacterium]